MGHYIFLRFQTWPGLACFKACSDALPYERLGRFCLTRSWGAQVAEVRWYSIGVMMEELEEALDGLQEHLHAYSKHIPDAAIRLYAKPHPEPEKDLMTP